MLSDQLCFAAVLLLLPCYSMPCGFGYTSPEGSTSEHDCRPINQCPAGTGEGEAGKPSLPDSSRPWVLLAHRCTSWCWWHACQVNLQTAKCFTRRLSKVLDYEVFLTVHQVIGSLMELPLVL
jgi:hypothetical protein